jgi:Protein of unknown function (DUF4244)
MTNMLRTVRKRLMQTLVRTRSDAGMSTAEYAVGTLAAAAFAMVLYKVVTSSQVQAAVEGIVHRALTLAF